MGNTAGMAQRKTKSKEDESQETPRQSEVAQQSAPPSEPEDIDPKAGEERPEPPEITVDFQRPGEEPTEAKVLNPPESGELTGYEPLMLEVSGQIVGPVPSALAGGGGDLGHWSPQQDSDSTA